jgi:NAD(P)-dependent dehydrogenase (short-subunit alcohol dehydrogenase family)
MASTDTSLPRPPPALSDSVLALFSLKGRTALVTGGATGIGAAVCAALAEAGARVAVAYNSSAGPAAALVEEMKEKYGVEGMAVKIAVEDAESVEKGVHAVFEHFGRLDIVRVPARPGRTPLIPRRQSQTRARAARSTSQARSSKTGAR